MSALIARFGPYEVCVRDEWSYVTTPDDNMVGVRRHDLADLRRMLEWLEAVWTAPDAGQPKLPLEAPDGQ